MKNKIILGLLCLSVLVLFSCEKSKNAEPQVSVAVKEYFGMVVEADKFKPTGNAMKSTKEEACRIDSSAQLTETSFYAKTVYLPCSGMEGYAEGIYYFENGNHKEHFEICFLDESIIGKRACHIFTEEEDYLSDGVKFIKREEKITEDGKPDFEHKVDAIFTVHHVINSEFIDENNVTNSANYSGLKGIETGCSEMLKKENVYNSINMEPVEYLYDQEWVGYDSEYGTLYISNLIPYKVKGIVKVEYERDGIQGEFTIDYGTGEKDHKATITEDGRSYEVDYKKLMDSILNEMYFE